MAPKVVDKEVKMQSIIEAAIHVFARQGVARTKMSDIAREARVGKGTLYEYFRTRDEVIIRSFQFIIREMELILRQIHSASLSADEKLTRLIAYYLAYFTSEKSDKITVILDLWAEGVGGRNAELLQTIDMKALYAGFRDTLAAIITEGIEQGRFRNVDAHTYASLMMAQLDGLMLQWALDPDVLHMDVVKKQLTYIFVEALCV